MTTISKQSIERTIHTLDFRVRRIPEPSKPTVDPRDAFFAARGVAYQTGQLEVYKAVLDVLVSREEEVELELVLQVLLDVTTRSFPTNELAERHLDGRRDAWREVLVLVANR